MDLVSAIAGLPWQRINSAPYLHKDGEKLDKNGMKTKYHLFHGRNGFLLSSINDSALRAAAKILCSKVLQKMSPTNCTSAIVELSKRCAQGVHINYSQFLLNKLMDDVLDTQELPTEKFHFSWPLILISFATWTPPPDY